MLDNSNYLTKKQPKLRFNEFNDEYTIFNMSDISTSYKGNGYKKEDIITDGKFNVILYGELFTTYKNIITNIKSKTNLIGKIKSCNNSLLIPGSSTSLNDFFPVCSINRDDVFLGGDINIFKINDQNNSNYLSYLFSSFNHLKNIFKLTEGSTINHLYSEFINDYKVVIPKINEQTKIADFLSLLDKQIDNISSKKDVLEKAKKFYLSNLFI